MRARAARIARHKIAWKWYTPAGNPTVVQPGWCLIDLETEDGGRRFYGVDRNGGTMTYVPELASSPLPPETPIESQAALEAFDAVWEAFDAEYACFGLRPKLDWERLGETYREEAERQRTTFGLAAVIDDMLARLENLHVRVSVADDVLPGYSRPRPLNASWEATKTLASATQRNGDDLRWGRTEDGIGYLCVTGLGDPGLPEALDAALERLGDTWGLVVDLRFNGGGDELLAREIAGRFLDEERVYATNRYRSGPDHDDLGEVLERRVAPRGPWRYDAPTIVLVGQRTLSSAESLALMLAQCPQVTTMGDRTGGSSGNPRRLELECGIAVNLPRWLDMDPDGEPIEHAGVAPEVEIEAEPEEFTDASDPVLEAALEELRDITPRRREPARDAE